MRNWRFSLLGLLLMMLVLASTTGLVLRTNIWRIARAVSDTPTFINHAVFSADSSQLLTVNNLGELCVWDIQSGTLLRKQKQKQNHRVVDAGFVVDRKAVALILDIGETHIYDIETGAIEENPEYIIVMYGRLYKGGTRSIGASSKGNTIHVSVFDTATQRNTVLKTEEGVGGASINRTGTLVAICRADGVTEIWELKGHAFSSLWKTWEFWSLILFSILLLSYISWKIVIRRRHCKTSLNDS